jgi:hypothetical protein
MRVQRGGKRMRVVNALAAITTVTSLQCDIRERSDHLKSRVSLRTRDGSESAAKQQRMSASHEAYREEADEQEVLINIFD